MTKTKTFLLAMALMVLSALVWNSAWRYDDMVLFGATRKVRTHLVTGESQWLSPHGWMSFPRP